MMIKILKFAFFIILASCSGGGGDGDGGSKSTTKALPAGKVIAYKDFMALVDAHDPLSGTSYSFNGNFDFNKENSKCSGNLKASVTLDAVTSNVTSSGYCKGKSIQMGINSKGLEFLNFEKIADGLKENLKIEELKSSDDREFRLSFNNQKDWTRSYTFKVKDGKVLFPVILRHKYKDGFQIMSYQITVQKGEGMSKSVERDTASSTKSSDVMDLAEEGIYSIF